MGSAEIRFLANSGVFIQYGGLRLLVDGIYGKNRFFTQPLKEIQLAVFGMNSPYRDADYVIHTHRHVDHFNAGYVDEYAANNNVKGVFAPRSSQDPSSFLEDIGPLRKAAAKGVLWEPAPAPGESASRQLGQDAFVTYYPCRHLDQKSYPAVAHCAVGLTLGQQRFLFAADADPCAENDWCFQGPGALTAVFVTPLFLIQPHGRQLLKTLAPEHVVIYHLPFQEDDVTGLRPMVERELADYGGELPLTALMEPGQTARF